MKKRGQDMAGLTSWLRTLGAQGQYAPTNSQIAAKFGYASTNGSALLIAEAERRGLIEVARGQSGRQITIDGVILPSATGSAFGPRVNRSATASPDQKPHTARNRKGGKIYQYPPVLVTHFRVVTLSLTATGECRDITFCHDDSDVERALHDASLQPGKLLNVSVDRRIAHVGNSATRWRPMGVAR